MVNKISVSYVTTLPKEGNAPRVTIIGDNPHRYHVTFNVDGEMISDGYCNTNQTITAKVKQWYSVWHIVITDEDGKIVYTDIFHLYKKVVFIKIDSYALGDTIAWIPFVEIFRKKHNCTVICSSFHNKILVDSYPEILFVAPNTVIDNVYCQYYIGASNEDNPYYSPIKVSEHPLQDVAAKILGLKTMEIRPNLFPVKNIHLINKVLEGNFVTISEFGSGSNKNWKTENGWQSVVNYLVNKGLQVVVISKEKTALTNVIDMSGDYPIEHRIIDIKHAKFHIGVSSGLSWLAWAIGTHVVMISDVTPSWHEFETDVTRINANDLNRVNYDADGQSSISEVLSKLEVLVNS